MTDPGRNDPCPCGSGRKYKKCCLPKQSAPLASLSWQKMRRTEGELVHALWKHADRHYGPGAAAEAWEEFSLWNDVPPDPETEPEVDTVFVPWFLFNWIPDNAELDEAEHYPEMPVALHYLQSASGRIDSFQRRFIEETCSQPYSFFVVTEVDPASGMSLRDLFLNREVRVHERQASATLRKGSIVYSRIIAMDGIAIMVGCAPIVIPPSRLHDFIDMREHFQTSVRAIDREFLVEYELELRTVYYDIREELLHPTLPKLANTDGEPLQWTTLHYRLECTPREAVEALATLALAGSPDELTENAVLDRHGEPVSVEFSWLKKGNRQQAGWDSTVLGHIVIDGSRLSIEVNSQERAEAIRRKLIRRLGRRAVFLHAVIQSAEKLLEETAGDTADGGEGDSWQSGDDLEANPDVRERLRQIAAQHWQDWVDSPLPALQGSTPREAVKTASGRERLEALFLQFEHDAGSQQAFAPDVASLRRVLGMA